MAKSTKSARRRIIRPHDRQSDLSAKFAIRGTDIFQNDDVDFSLLKDDGIHFTVCRAHFGTTPDTKHAAYISAARSVGQSVGSYGFILPAQNIDEQVALGVSAVHAMFSFRSGDVGFWADVEGEKRWKAVPAANRNQTVRRRLIEETRRETAEAWLAAASTPTKRMDILLRYLHGMKDGTGSMPGIYASAHFLNEIFDDTTPLADLIYWVAHYNVDAPDVQKPFKGKNPPWHLWQAFENAIIKAIEKGQKKADLNYFFGSKADYIRLFGNVSWLDQVK